MSIAPHVSPDAFNAQVDAFLGVHCSRPTHSLIANVHARVDAVTAGNVRLPATINDDEDEQAWICSPYTTYYRYALEEVARFGHPLLSAPLRLLIHGAGALLRRSRIDRAVTLNHWLVSTNSYPCLHDVDLDRAITEAKDRWPDHALWFRSLNTAHHADWLRALIRLGGVLLPSRQVYLFDDVASLAHRHRDLKRDLALLRKGEGVTCAPLQEDDHDRAAALYHELYVRKYSPLNPQYRSDLLRAWSHAGLLHLHGLRDDRGVLQGVVGILRMGNLLTSPIVGYNTALPQKLGLYRRLAARVLHEAAEQDDLVNLSAGVADFKRQRGGRPAIEYSVVLVDHLPRARRHALRALGGILRGIGVPVMKRFRL
ncbi:GNAT family N-acetyltransferase [Oleiagrimonas sp. MCCC 1A03011]|uniref:GNAT family N-acetyltransferase n=1 Tax=Oleiagrimonas sp. MCCC 1A03011 TaxID=1926883 RepID=UPI000DD61C04|nr:GNAT family N-acetyltransferase [Oleiagrimonas sp. MCCC 1A03011]